MSVFVAQHSVENDFKLDEPWTILSEIEQSIKRKIEAVGTPLKDWNISINYGIKTGLNEAFIISKEKRDELIAQDPKSAEIIRPILRGRDIEKNSIHFQDTFLINTHNGYVSKNGNEVPAIDINDYPAVKTWLDSPAWNKMKNDKTSFMRLSQRTDQGITPYNLRSLAYMDDFSKPKIIFSEMVQSPQFYLDCEGYIVNDTVTFIIGDNLTSLKNGLNSKLIFSIYKLFYAGGGLGAEGVRVKKSFLEHLPLPKSELLRNENTDEILIKILGLTTDEVKFLLRDAILN